MTGTAKTYYEVLWGIEDHERQTWIDYGDGTAASLDAAVNAGRLLLEVAKHGGKAGLFVNGVHKAGDAFGEEWAGAEKEAAAGVAAWEAYRSDTAGDDRA